MQHIKPPRHTNVPQPLFNEKHSDRSRDPKANRHKLEPISTNQGQPPTYSDKKKNVDDISPANFKNLNEQAQMESRAEDDRANAERAVALADENQFFVTGVDVKGQTRVPAESPERA